MHAHIFPLHFVFGQWIATPCECGAAPVAINRDLSSQAGLAATARR